MATELRLYNRGHIQMSKTTIMNNISRLQREIADVTKKLSQESKKESDCGKRIAQLLNSITKSTSPSQLRSKLSEIVTTQPLW